MYLLIIILHLILLVILTYTFIKFYGFRKRIETHIHSYRKIGLIERVSVGTEKGIENNLSEIEGKMAVFKSVIDENRMLKENSGKIMKELSETKDHLMSKISELHAIFEISTSITLLTQSGNLYDSIPEAINRYLGIEEVALFVFHDDKKGLVPVSYSNSLEEAFKGNVIKPSEGIVGRVYRTGESVYIPDLSRASEQIHLMGQLKNIRSIIVVPLKRRDRTIGVFYIGHREENAFDPETVGTVKTLVRNISIAIENTELYQYAKMLAERDSLTLLYNHGTFHSRLDYELERASRYRRSVAVIMLDIDAFKLVNDNFGHVTGDRILKMVAGVINAHTRKTDIASRYGGDEFAILLPETDHDAALTIAKRICFSLKNIKVDTGKGGEISVTASFGIASCKHDSTDREKIVEIADTLMYSAKSEGYGEIASKSI